jgi:hypothetical protein
METGPGWPEGRDGVGFWLSVLRRYLLSAVGGDWNIDYASWTDCPQSNTHVISSRVCHMVPAWLGFIAVCSPFVVASYPSADAAGFARRSAR